MTLTRTFLLHIYRDLDWQPLRLDGILSSLTFADHRGIGMMDHRRSHFSYSIDRKSHLRTSQNIQNSFSFKPQTNCNSQPRSNFVFKPGANLNTQPQTFHFKPNTKFVYKLRLNNEVTVTNRTKTEVLKEVNSCVEFQYDSKSLQKCSIVNIIVKT